MPSRFSCCSLRQVREFRALSWTVLLFVANPLAGQQQTVAQDSARAASADAVQESASAGPTNQDRRLEEIERALRDLLQEVKSLRDSADAAGSGDQDQTTKSSRPGTLLPDEWLEVVTWRPIGPANMGGRIVDIAVHEGDPLTFWVATASGGLLKTTNNGVTFEHQFDHQTTVSIGAVAVAASDPSVVWVGTGENNPRNSVSYGDGVYKSTDGGKTWKHVGLNETYQIGRILIHPRDPNTVYVGALGRLYGPNPERGLYKTTDGGDTWTKVFYVDEKTGVIDMRMHPTDPSTLVVAMWGRQRDGFDAWPGEVPVPDGYNGYDPIQKWGPGGGLFKTSDGGETWKKLTQGLPTSNFGRVGLDWYRRDPNVLFAVIDCEDIGKGPKPFTAYLGVVGQNVDGKARFQQVLADSPAAKAGLEVGDILEAVEDQQVTDFDQLLDRLREKRPGERITLRVSRGGEAQTVEVALTVRPGQRGRGSTVWLGVTGGNRAGKVQLNQILAGSPAAKAELKAGDVVLAVEGQPLDDYSKLLAAVRERQAGAQLKLQIARGEDQQEIVVTLEDRPGTRRRSNVFMGIQGEDAEGGARLTAITPGGPSEKAGLMAGDLVEKIDGAEVPDYATLVAEIRRRQPDDKMKVGVSRKGEQKEIVVTLAARTSGSATRPYGFSYGGQSPNVQDQQGAQGFKYGGVYKSTDQGETWTRVNSLNSRPMYFSQIRVDPSDQRYVHVLGVAQYRSSDGGQTFSGDLARGVHADGHAMWIDPRDGRHLIIGSDGGPYVSYDRGENWDHLNHLAIGQFYHVAISPQQPYYVTGGLQDNGTWFGPSLTRSGSGPINEDWLSVGGGDGFMCRVDPEDPNLVYYTSQNGAMRRRNMKTGASASLRPRPAAGEKPYRFNWNTPFILSSHNSRIFYSAGNFVFRSLNRGSDPQKISPEITHTQRGSGTAVSESPLDPNVLYAGTDDGALWVTRDGGQNWQEVSQQVGLPGPRWVATIEASRFEAGRVYVAFDGHRSDDDDPYVCVSEDYGQTWRSLRANLPRGSSRCLREDLQNPELLFLGTEFGAWFSLDRGSSWNQFNTNLPTVAVHELALHPNNGELVAATHGRSLWICDVSVLRQITRKHLTDQIALYQPEPAIRWQREPRRGRTNRRFVGSNPDAGAQIYYSLPADAQQVSLAILDITGRPVRQLPVSNESGLHRVTWDLTQVASRQRQGSGQRRARRGRVQNDSPEGRSPATESQQRGRAAATGAAAGAAADQDRPAGGEARPTRPARPAPAARPTPSGGRTRTAGPGPYRIVLNVDGQRFTQIVHVHQDPHAPPTTLGAEENLWHEVEKAQKELRDTRNWIDD